ncbi:MAG: hypothetical protein ABI165_17675 [Bryobacteraceae bacterium]
MTRIAVILLVAVCARARAGQIPYWIQPCADARTACKSGDPQLAAWALAAWETASHGRLRLVEMPAPDHARIRVYWVTGLEGLYGETRPVEVDGKKGAEMFIRPDVSTLGPTIAAAAGRDPLLREAIVYLTCLHESGHALGLAHTAAFDDIMYTFALGGDIDEYFARYRRQIATRGDIRRHPGLSPADREHLIRALADPR